MNTYIRLFGKEYTKNDFYTKVKKYAEKHTALVTAIISGVLTATILFLNLLYASYKVGELAYFNVDTSYAFTQDRNSLILKILFYLSFASIFLLTNFLGYLSYLRRFFIKYILILTSVLIVLFYTVLAVMCDSKEIFNEFVSVLITVSFYSFFFAISLSSFSIAYMMSPSKKDKIARLELKKSKLTNKEKLTEKKKNKINKKIEALNQTLNKKDTSNINSENKNTDHHYLKTLLFLKPILIVCYIGIVVIAFLWLGFSQSGHKTSFDTISINSLSSMPDNTFYEYQFEEYIILFENSEYMIISPYVTEQNDTDNDNITIFTSLQIKTDNKNVIRKKRSIKNITIDSNVNDLDNYKTINS